MERNLKDIRSANADASDASAPPQPRQMVAEHIDHGISLARDLRLAQGPRMRKSGSGDMSAALAEDVEFSVRIN